ncbi:MAG: hypothetical protein MK008_10445 [Bdellovibrionales bacterium]|nr:hypothetical protein [Bdellovibrionales bacterium]
MINNKIEIIKSNLGFGLIEVMIAAGISVVVILGISTSLSKVFKMQKISAQKIQALETKNHIITALSSPTTCLNSVKSSGTSTVNLSVAQPKKNLLNIPFTSAPGSEKIVTVGNPLSPITPGLSVSKIELINFTGGPSQYIADLLVFLDSSSSTNFNFKPLSFKVKINIDSTSPMTAADITSCGSNEIPSFYHVKNFTAGKTAVALCNSDDLVIGCSGARDKDLNDSCSEQDCGYIGALPVGPPSYPSNGCIAKIDDDPGTEATVIAFCRTQN